MAGFHEVSKMTTRDAAARFSRTPPPWCCRRATTILAVPRPPPPLRPPCWRRVVEFDI